MYMNELFKFICPSIISGSEVKFLIEEDEALSMRHFGFFIMYLFYMSLFFMSVSHCQQPPFAVEGCDNLWKNLWTTFFMKGLIPPVSGRDQTPALCLAQSCILCLSISTWLHWILCLSICTWLQIPVNSWDGSSVGCFIGKFPCLMSWMEGRVIILLKNLHLLSGWKCALYANQWERTMECDGESNFGYCVGND